jgi:hypothetical protein
VYLSSVRLLVLDESNALPKKLSSAYSISLATPPLVDFDFDLAFVKKGVTPAPAAIKLPEALQQIGYSGPRVTDLNMMNMYVISFPPLTTEGVRKPAASFIFNIDLGGKTLVANLAMPFPSNTTIAAHPSITLGPLSIIHISAVGWYIFTGSWCITRNSGYQMTSLSINNVPSVKRIRHNMAPKVDDETIPNSFPFTFIVQVTDELMAVNGGFAKVSVMCYSSVNADFQGGFMNFLDVAMI